MSIRTADTAEQIAATDDFHIAPYRADGHTSGTLTWIWPVVVDGRVSVRAYNSRAGRSQQTAQQAGTISAAGTEHDVTFTAVDDADLGAHIGSAYEPKYAGSPCLPPMIVTGPKAATVEVTRRDTADHN